MTVSPSVLQHGITRFPLEELPRKIYVRTVTKIVEQNCCFSKPDKKTVAVYNDRRTFMIKFRRILLKNKVSERICKQKQKPHFIFK